MRRKPNTDYLPYGLSPPVVLTLERSPKPKPLNMNCTYHERTRGRSAWLNVHRVVLAFLLAAFALGAQAQTFSVIGTGTAANTTSGYPAPFGNYYWGSRHQFVVTAAELTSAGVAANSVISSVGFNVTATNSASAHTGWNIRVFTTATANPISAGWFTGTPVAQTATTDHTPVAGWNQFPLTSSFIWNGTDNLIIETCHNNTGYNVNANTQWTTTLTGATFSRWFRADAAGVCTNTSTSGTSTTTRPNIRIEWTAASACTGQPAPGNTVASVSTVCSGVNFTLSLQNSTSGTGVTYQWQSADDAAFTVNTANLGTGVTQTTSLTSSKYYRCLVTCTSSGQSQLSTPVLVSLNGNTCECNNYCFGANNCGADYISAVNFAGINRTSTCDAGTFNLYSSPNPTLTGGTTYPITISTGGDVEGIGIWFDWNGNGVFDDVTERIPSAQISNNGFVGTNPATYTANITVPVTATPGSTRMRVRCNYNGVPAGACTVQTWGETEDYCITIAAPDPCTGTPAPGNTVGPVSVCPSANFNLTLQNSTTGSGVTYQWESADDAAFTVNVTSLGTSFTQTTSQTTAKYYRCLVSCTFSGQATYSNTLFVPMGSACQCGTYCTTSNAGDGACITSVSINTLASSSPACVTTPGYTLKNETTTILKGVSYSLTVTANANVYGGAISSAWFDWNNDGVFAADEWTQVATTGTSGTVSIAVPLTAFEGTIRMRVRTRGQGNVNGATDACTVMGSGTTEDFCITVGPTPACLPPSLVTAAGTSSTSATVTWSGTGTFIVEYGPATTFTIPGTDNTGGPEATSTVITGITGNSYTIPGGLTHPTQYRVFVRKDCTGSAEGYSVNSPGVTFYTQPPNDLCSNAPNVSVGVGATVTISGNSFGATDTEGFGAMNAWESITVTDCMQSLEINYCATTQPWTLAFLNLFTDCSLSGFIAPTSAVNDCPNGNRRHIYGNIPPGTYYIGITNMVGGQGPYTITVIGGTACPPPPANDVCSSAVPISCGETLNGTTVDATITGAPNSVCNGFLNNDSGGVWYVADNLCGPVSASLCSTTPTWDSKLAVYSGSCGSLVCVSTNDDFCGLLSQVSWTADANETYYIYVLGLGATNSGAFSLALTCTNTPVAATATATDDCANNQFSVAVNITDLGGAASATVNYSVNGVAQPPVTGAGLGVTPLGPFAATAEVSVTVGNGASGCTANLGNYYSNCPVTIACASPAFVVNYCYRNNDTKTWTFINDTPGETITVTFVSGAMAPGDVIRFYNGTDNSDLITGSNYPDLTGVTVTTSIGVSAMFIELESIGTGSCADGDPLASPWQFEVECTAGCLDPNGAVTPNVNCATYSFTLDVEVFDTGDAPTVDLVYTVNGGSPTTIPGLDINSGIQNIGPFTIGSIVNVVLQHESDNACDKNLGNFQPGLACPPPGTSCALPFVVNSYPFTQSNTTCGKGNNVIGTQCGLGANYGGGEDFVYQLNISSAGDYQISLQLTGGAQFGGWFLKSSTNCGNASQCIANAVTGAVANGTASSIVNLAAGTYFLIVDSRPIADLRGLQPQHHALRVPAGR